MPLLRIRKYLVGMLLGCACLACVPARAETLQQLDALSDASTDEATGIASAREQAGRGEYLDALATLERVLAAHPRSRQALLIHALYLCQIDDRQGGLVEIGKMKTKDYGKKTLNESQAACERGAEG